MLVFFEFICALLNPFEVLARFLKFVLAWNKLRELRTRQSLGHDEEHELHHEVEREEHKPHHEVERDKVQGLQIS